MKISEVNVVPIKPTNGLVAFASVVVDESLYLGSIGIHTRPNGSFRITYPTKKVGVREMNLYHPIKQDVGKQIEQVVLEKYQQIFERSDDNDRHNKASGKNGQGTLFKSELPADA